MTTEHMAKRAILVGQKDNWVSKYFMAAKTNNIEDDMSQTFCI